MCEIVKTIQLFVNKSFNLYEATVKELLNFLCTYYVNNDLTEDESLNKIDNKLAQLFQFFDLVKILPIIYKYFEVIIKLMEPSLVTSWLWTHLISFDVLSKVIIDLA